MKALITLVSIFVLLTDTISATCPSEDETFSCECSEEEDHLEVDCYGSELTLEELRASLAALPKDVAIDLVLDEMSLGSVPSDFFAGFNIKRLDISHCELDSLTGGGGRPLTGLEDTLEELDILSSFSEENEVTKLDLSHLRKLSELDLSFNAITELGDDWFARGPASLTSIVFSNNHIQKVGENAFANLNNLETLSFDGNRFGEIKRSMLPNPANSLNKLELDNNAFTSVPQDLFSNMPALRILSLRTNGIRKITEETFRPIWQQMKVLDFRGNPLECDSYIDWMKNVKTPAVVLGKCEAPHDKLGVALEDIIA